MRDFQNTRVVVVGAGRTGLSLCVFFSGRGARVVLSDSRPADRIEHLDRLDGLGVELDLGGHTEALFCGADLVVLSPGVSMEIPPVAAATKAGVAVLGEIEIAYGALDAPVIGITGTNGKSTTTVVMGLIFEQWGKRTFVGGNLGTPLIEATAQKGWDYLVTELSSFQLEAIDAFRSRYGLLLNITADHLDRYPDMECYVGAKLRLFENMNAQDVAVLNAEDAEVMKAAVGIGARQVCFSSCRLLDEGMGFDGGQIVWRLDGAETRFDSSELQLKGVHNIENVMAAMIPPLMEGCPPQLAWQTACSFSGLAHRMALVRVLDGVSWYNDSKGTNVGSVVKSLQGLSAPVTLILGGKDKGGEYAPLADLVREKVAHLVLIGQASDRIDEALGGLTHTVGAGSMEHAVSVCRDLTPSGGTVLLSPGCSSFDMFRSYEHRGEVFAHAVLALSQKEARP